MDTGFGSVRDELFRAIERYDVKKLLKASSASSLEVISEEELHKLLKHKNNQWIREEFKRLILENGRLKKFAGFILDYNNHVQNAALAVLQNESRSSTDTKLPLPANACPTRNRWKGCPADPTDLVESDDKSGINNYCSQTSSWSSSNSRTPPSPMEVDTKDTDLISVAENETSDFGYCSATGPSSKDMQGQTSSGYHYSEPIPGKTSVLPIVMKKKTPSDPANLDLSQPTITEHKTVNGWLLQSTIANDKHYYNNGSLNLSQDLTHPGQPQAITDNLWISSKHRVHKKPPHDTTVDCAISRDSPGPLRPSVTDKDRNGYQPAADGWPPLFKQHCRDIMQSLNMGALLPHLIANNLLTQEEWQELNRSKELPQRFFLLSVLPRKGKNAFKVFLSCLKAEKQHLGHQELVKLLCDM